MAQTTFVANLRNFRAQPAQRKEPKCKYFVIIWSPLPYLEGREVVGLSVAVNELDRDGTFQLWHFVVSGGRVEKSGLTQSQHERLGQRPEERIDKLSMRPK
jgi:hypothetical protein